ncbi:Domain of unknown function DUF4371 [Cinara cedri]|uniref:Uncharacterized protein n=1 Tax=Cinara cedri TaxID=506608 RepID=A0A5E4NB33_9HEMI|nr:Domain of unknown function DUF4371 [Cinara cedri]
MFRPKYLIDWDKGIGMLPRKSSRQGGRRRLKAILFLTKQGISFWGHNEFQSSTNTANFTELLEMFADDDTKTDCDRGCSPEYQNDRHVVK